MITNFADGGGVDEQAANRAAVMSTATAPGPNLGSIASGWQAAQQTGDYGNLQGLLQGVDPTVLSNAFGFRPEDQDYFSKMTGYNWNAAPAAMPTGVIPPAAPTTTPNLFDQLTKAGLVNTSALPAVSPYAGQVIQTSAGPLNYNDIAAQVQSRYEEGKNPTLAVKSALQLGIPEDVILTLPGVTPAALTAGKQLITSGAFGTTAETSDTKVAAKPGTPVYNARMAAGLDAYGFPPEEVARRRVAGTYVEPTTV